MEIESFLDEKVKNKRVFEIGGLVALKIIQKEIFKTGDMLK